MSGQFKSFVSEEEVKEKRQQRQAEWEKVRQPDDPIECPEEETRSLFEQLQANKELKDREYEDETKLRSKVKGLDDEEVQFLNFVSDRQIQLEKERHKEENSVIEEMKKASVVKVQEKKDKTAVSCETSKASNSRNSQKQLLQGAIKRKSSDASKPDVVEKKAKDDTSDQEKPDAKLMAGISQSKGFMVVAGILPGIADYAEDDSSTENESQSSDSETDHQIIPGVLMQRMIMEYLQQRNADD